MPANICRREINGLSNRSAFNPMQVEKPIPFAGRLKERSYTYFGENAIGGAQYGIGEWGHISSGDSSRIVHRISQPACRSACDAVPPPGVRRPRLSHNQLAPWTWSEIGIGS